MVKYYADDTNTYKVLIIDDDGCWVINMNCANAPRFVSFAAFGNMKEVPADEVIIPKLESASQNLVVQKKLSILGPLTKTDEYIKSRSKRTLQAKQIAEEEGISVRSVLRFFYAYLAKGPAGLLPASRNIPKKAKSTDQKKIEKALNQYYYSPYRMSLRMAYEMMLLTYYQKEDGSLQEKHPSYYNFCYYFRKSRDKQKEAVARKGIGDYQKNQRPLLGNGDSGIRTIGFYEMDATLADIYIVSRYDRKPIGRPYIYMAIDVASRLITGVYVGLEAGSSAVLACLANAVSDKVEFCRNYGIEIHSEQWPAAGLPNRICTDRGNEFACEAIWSLCETYQMEVISLPPYRPDLKGYIEKAFDCIQSRFKPLLHGMGVIEETSTANGAPDYYKQASLDLNEFTRVVIECILYYNTCNVLNDFIRTPKMAAADVQPFAANVWTWYWETGRKDITWLDSRAVELLLMPRATAQFTRYGLKFKDLYYTNPEYEKEFVHPKSKSVTIAYFENDNRIIYLIQKSQYIQFSLTLASQRYAGLSVYEMDILMEHEKAVTKQAKEKQVSGSIQCSKNIMAIRDSVERQNHDCDATKKKNVKETRRREKRYE